jgi:hypothetical protein
MNNMFVDTRGMLEVSKDLKVSVKQVDGADVLIVDNFFANPERILNFIDTTPAPIWKAGANTRNFIDYYDCRHIMGLAYFDPVKGTWPMEIDNTHAVLKSMIKHFYKVDVKYMESYSLISNIFKNLKENKGGPRPHQDGGEVMTSVIYMNKDEDGASGTSFHTSKFNNVANINNLTFNEHRAMNDFYAFHKLSEDGTNYYLEDYDKYWEEADYVESKFNRLVVFRGDIWHSAKHTGSQFMNEPRKNFITFLDVINSKRKYDKF